MTAPDYRIDPDAWTSWSVATYDLERAMREAQTHPFPALGREWREAAEELVDVPHAPELAVTLLSDGWRRRLPELVEIVLALTR